LTRVTRVDFFEGPDRMKDFKEPGWILTRSPSFRWNFESGVFWRHTLPVVERKGHEAVHARLDAGDVRLELAERARRILLTLLFLGRDLALAAEVVLGACRRSNRRSSGGGGCGGRRDRRRGFRRGRGRRRGCACAIRDTVVTGEAARVVGLGPAGADRGTDVRRCERGAGLRRSTAGHNRHKRRISDLPVRFLAAVGIDRLEQRDDKLTLLIGQVPGATRRTAV
jgi:hypothetical protein